jgi:hypothetical protein
VSEAASAVFDAARRRKFRQAAFFYLQMGVLYEGAVLAMARRGILSARRVGPVWIWLVFGAAIVGAVFWGLFRKESVWTARIIWALGLFRLPALLEGAFFPLPTEHIPPSFYLTALVVVLINLWLLARAGWDL